MRHDRWDGSNGHDGVWRTVVDPARAARRGRATAPTTLAEQDHPLAEGHARPSRGSHRVEHLLAMMVRGPSHGAGTMSNSTHGVHPVLW